MHNTALALGTRMQQVKQNCTLSSSRFYQDITYRQEEIKRIDGLISNLLEKGEMFVEIQKLWEDLKQEIPSLIEWHKKIYAITSQQESLASKTAAPHDLCQEAEDILDSICCLESVNARLKQAWNRFKQEIDGDPQRGIQKFVASRVDPILRILQQGLQKEVSIEEEENFSLEQMPSLKELGKELFFYVKPNLYYTLQSFVKNLFEGNYPSSVQKGFEEALPEVTAAESFLRFLLVEAAHRPQVLHVLDDLELQVSGETKKDIALLLKTFRETPFLEGRRGEYPSEISRQILNTISQIKLSRSDQQRLNQFVYVMLAKMKICFRGYQTAFEEVDFKVSHREKAEYLLEQIHILGSDEPRSFWKAADLCFSEISLEEDLCLHDALLDRLLIKEIYEQLKKNPALTTSFSLESTLGKYLNRGMQQGTLLFNFPRICTAFLVLMIPHLFSEDSLSALPFIRQVLSHLKENPSDFLPREFFSPFFTHFPRSQTLERVCQEMIPFISPLSRVEYWVQRSFTATSSEDKIVFFNKAIESSITVVDVLLIESLSNPSNAKSLAVKSKISDLFDYLRKEQSELFGAEESQDLQADILYECIQRKPAASPLRAWFVLILFYDLILVGKSESAMDEVRSILALSDAELNLLQKPLKQLIRVLLEASGVAFSVKTLPEGPIDPECRHLAMDVLEKFVNPIDRAYTMLDLLVLLDAKKAEDLCKFLMDSIVEQSLLLDPESRIHLLQECKQVFYRLGDSVFLENHEKVKRALHEATEEYSELALRQLADERPASEAPSEKAWLDKIVYVQKHIKLIQYFISVNSAERSVNLVRNIEDVLKEIEPDFISYDTCVKELFTCFKNGFHVVAFLDEKVSQEGIPEEARIQWRALRKEVFDLLWEKVKMVPEENGIYLLHGLAIDQTCPKDVRIKAFTLFLQSVRSGYSQFRENIKIEILYMIINMETEIAKIASVEESEILQGSQVVLKEVRSYLASWIISMLKVVGPEFDKEKREIKKSLTSQQVTLDDLYQDLASFASFERVFFEEGNEGKLSEIRVFMASCQEAIRETKKQIEFLHWNLLICTPQEQVALRGFFLKNLTSFTTKQQRFDLVKGAIKWMTFAPLKDLEKGFSFFWDGIMSLEEEEQNGFSYEFLEEVKGYFPNLIAYDLLFVFIKERKVPIEIRKKALSFFLGKMEDLKEDRSCPIFLRRVLMAFMQNLAQDVDVQQNPQFHQILEGFHKDLIFQEQQLLVSKEYLDAKRSDVLMHLEILKQACANVSEGEALDSLQRKIAYEEYLLGILTPQEQIKMRIDLLTRLQGGNGDLVDVLVKDALPYLELNDCDAEGLLRDLLDVLCRYQEKNLDKFVFFHLVFSVVAKFNDVVISVQEIEKMLISLVEDYADVLICREHLFFIQLQNSFFESLDFIADVDFIGELLGKLIQVLQIPSTDFPDLADLLKKVQGKHDAIIRGS